VDRVLQPLLLIYNSSDLKTRAKKLLNFKPNVVVPATVAMVAVNNCSQTGSAIGPAKVNVAGESAV